MQMNERIKELCKDIEKRNNIRILFAVENGSRAWRMESKDSDYDVRFVFVRPIEEYVRIKKPAEVILATFDEEGVSCDPKEAFIDMSGFDLLKYAGLLGSSNPTAIEWLVTDIVYYGRQNARFKDFAEKRFNPLALYQHYKSLCKSNYIKYLKSGNVVTYKKYLYSYRGIINAKWVAHKRTLPPIKFTETMGQMKGILPESVLKKLEEILILKSEGKEKDIVQNIVVMDNHIEEFLKDESEIPNERHEGAIEELDKEIRKIVMRDWPQSHL